MKHWLMRTVTVSEAMLDIILILLMVTILFHIDRNVYPTAYYSWLMFTIVGPIVYFVKRK